MFNPSASQYKKVEDLPKEEQTNFTDVDGGFVRKDAKAELVDAYKIVDLANQFKKAGMSGKDVLKIRSMSRVVQEAGKALDENKTATDILRERSIKEEYKPIDVLRSEANEINGKKYPEDFYIERLRKNPEDLNGIPKRIWGNKRFAMEAVRLNGRALGRIGYSRRPLLGKDYDEVVREAVKHDGLALQFAPNPLRANKDIVLEAVKQNPEAIKYASKDIKESLKRLLEA